jgi:hypothetical protein
MLGGTNNPAPAASSSSSGYCNWGPDGTGASSICEGGELGNKWCNASENKCESDCGGRWCTSQNFPSPSIDCPPRWKEASLTYYNSYAPCCEDSPNYDSSADTTECVVYNAFNNIGQLAYSGQKSLEWLQSNNNISFSAALTVTIHLSGTK